MKARRAFERVTISMVAGVLLESRPDPILCMMLDYAPGGARLRFTTAPELPGTFLLRVPRLDMSYQAQVRWYCGAEVGVSLIE